MNRRRFSTSERLSLAAGTAVLGSTIALYLYDVFGPDVDGVNPSVFLVGAGMSAALFFIPLATSRQRARSTASGAAKKPDT